MSNRYAAAALNLDTRNRFALFGEEEGEERGRGEGMASCPSTSAAPVRSLPPLPKVGGSLNTPDASGPSYGDRLRARKAGSTVAPNLTSSREFPTLGGGGGGGGGAGAGAGSKQLPSSSSSSSSFPTLSSPSFLSSSSWASKAHAFAEHDAREKEANALKARREEIDRTNLVKIGMFRAAKAPTGPTVADYEEEDRLRGLLGANDSYRYDYSYRPTETGSYTPPYPPYDEEEPPHAAERDAKEDAGDEERW